MEHLVSGDGIEDQRWSFDPWEELLVDADGFVDL